MSPIVENETLTISRPPKKPSFICTLFYHKKGKPVVIEEDEDHRISYTECLRCGEREGINTIKFTFEF